MRMKTFDWLGREFVAVSCEGADGVAADQGMDGILDRIEAKVSAGSACPWTTRSGPGCGREIGRAAASAARPVPGA